MRLFFEDKKLMLSCNVVDSEIKFIVNNFKFIHKEKNLYVKSIYTFEDIKRIKKFCDDVNVKLVFDEKISHLFDQNFKKNEIFNDKKKYLSDFKNGQVNSDHFKEHLAILSDLPCKPTNDFKELKEHQIKSSFHMYHAGNGANFSVPGSGKTTALYATYHRLKKEEKVDALFVIGPPSCFQAWKRDYKNVFGVSPSYTEFQGGNIFSRKAKYTYDNYNELNLCTFHTAANDADSIPDLFRRARCMMVIDEAHYIKGSGSWARNIIALSKKAKFRIALTGTPAPQSYQDLFNIYDFLYDDIKLFSKKDRLELINIEKKIKKSDVFDNLKELPDQNMIKAQDIIEKSTGAFCYRVRKKELKLAKQNPENIIKVKMNKHEKFIYNSIVSKINSLSENDISIEDYDLLDRLKRGRMMRLRQTYSNCSLLLKKDEHHKDLKHYKEDLIGDDNNLKGIIENYLDYEKPAKVDVLINIVSKLIDQNKKVLIWTNFVGTIKLLEKELSVLNHRIEKIYGATPKAISKKNTILDLTRDEIANEFNDSSSDLKILIANPAACAESISLHKACNNAIYYDLSYNCAQFLQSKDRIHRVGGSEDRISYYDCLIYEETKEDEILKKLNLKAKKMLNIIDKDYAIYNPNFLDIDNIDIETDY